MQRCRPGAWQVILFPVLTGLADGLAPKERRYAHIARLAPTNRFPRFRAHRRRSPAPWEFSCTDDERRLPASAANASSDPFSPLQPRVVGEKPCVDRVAAGVPPRRSPLLSGDLRDVLRRPGWPAHRRRCRPASCRSRGSPGTGRRQRLLQASVCERVENQRLAGSKRVEVRARLADGVGGGERVTDRAVLREQGLCPSSRLR